MNWDLFVNMTEVALWRWRDEWGTVLQCYTYLTVVLYIHSLTATCSSSFVFSHFHHLRVRVSSLQWFPSSDTTGQ